MIESTTESKNESKITIYTMPSCPFCTRAKELMKQRGVSFKENLLSMDDEAAWDALYKRSKMQTMPQIFAGDRLVGGYDQLAKLDKEDQLASLKG